MPKEKSYPIRLIVGWDRGLQIIYENGEGKASFVLLVRELFDDGNREKWSRNTLKSIRFVDSGESRVVFRQVTTKEQKKSGLFKYEIVENVMYKYHETLLRRDMLAQLPFR